MILLQQKSAYNGEIRIVSGKITIVIQAIQQHFCQFRITVLKCNIGTYFMNITTENCEPSGQYRGVFILQPLTMYC